MITRYRMSIGGVQLDSCLDDNEQFEAYKDKIVLLNIGYFAPEFSKTVETAGESDGGIVTKEYRQKASVTVTFGLYIYDVADRNKVCEIIKGLAAKGGTITTNDKPGKALYNAVCDSYPEIDSARDWTAPLTMTFSGYSFPYWQDTTQTPKTLSGKKTSASVAVPGNAPKANTIVEIIAKESSSAAIRAKAYISPIVTVGINGNYLYISYPFANNNYCLIDYDSRDNLRIRVYDNKTSMKLIASLLEYVLPTSSDKLLAKPGQNNSVSIDSLLNISATFKVRGAWL